MIQIDKKPYSVTSYYGGVYQDEKEEEFEFTLTDMSDENSVIIDITWLTSSPENTDEIEELIINEYQNQ